MANEQIVPFGNLVSKFPLETEPNNAIIERNFRLPLISTPAGDIPLCMHTDSIQCLFDAASGIDSRVFDHISILTRDMTPEQEERVKRDPVHILHLSGRLARAAASQDLLFLFNGFTGTSRDALEAYLKGYDVATLQGKYGYKVKWVKLSDILSMGKLRANELLATLGGCNSLRFRVDSQTYLRFLDRYQAELTAKISERNRPGTISPSIIASISYISLSNALLPKDNLSKIIKDDTILNNPNKYIPDRLISYNNINKKFPNY